MKPLHRGFALFAAMVVAHVATEQFAAVPGTRPAPPLDEPLVPGPGMLIGRVITRDGRPVPLVTIEHAAHAVGGNGVLIDGDAERNVAVKVDGRNGSHEIRLPERSYGLAPGVTLPLLGGGQTSRFRA